MRKNEQPLLCGFSHPCKWLFFYLRNHLTAPFANGFRASCNAFTGKVETLAWTPHLEHCLKSLERAEEYVGDGILALFVRIQQISDEANKCLVQDLLWSGTEPRETPTYLHKARLLDGIKHVREIGASKFPLSCKHKPSSPQKRLTVASVSADLT